MRIQKGHPAPIALQRPAPLCNSSHRALVCLSELPGQSSSFGWEHYAGRTGAILGMTTFGASAPVKVLQKQFGFTTERIVDAAMQQVSQAR
jgi:hypothetical protein